MKKIKITLLFCMLITFLVSCDSPLSDVEIDDPKLINCTFLVDKIIENGSETEYARAIITDKNLGLVRIKNGGVDVNGQELKYNDILKHYESDIQFRFNTNYVFTVELANGNSYDSDVTTPQSDFGTVDVPSQIKLKDNVLVTWTTYNTDKNIKIIYQLKSEEDSMWYDVFETSTDDDGSYTINYSYLNLPESVARYSEAKVILTKSTTGTLNSNLRGGTITSNHTYKQTIDITSQF